MKANAPERLYLSETIYSTYLYQVPDPDDESAVEYTRTDAFVDKACDWLSDNLQTVVDVDHPSAHHVESIPAHGIITQTEFIEAFRQFMKGE